MVFEPTFEQIDDEAAQLPDLGGDGPAPDEPHVEASDGDDEGQEAVSEGAAEAAIVDGDAPADDLPPFGED